MTYDEFGQDENLNPQQDLLAERDTTPDWKSSSLNVLREAKLPAIAGGKKSKNQRSLASIFSLAAFSAPREQRSLSQRLRARAVDTAPLMAVALVACSGGGGGSTGGSTGGGTHLPVTIPPITLEDGMFDIAVGQNGNQDAQGVPQNIIIVGRLMAEGAEGASIDYEVTGGSDAGDFFFDNGSDALKYRGDAVTASESFEIEITASSGGGSSSATFTIDAIAATTPPAFASPAPFSAPAGTYASPAVTYSGGQPTLEENAPVGANGIAIAAFADPTDTDGTPVEVFLTGPCVQIFELRRNDADDGWVVFYTGNPLDAENLVGQDNEGNPVPATLGYIPVTVAIVSGGQTTIEELQLSAGNVDEAHALSVSAPAALAIDSDGSSTAITVATATATDPEGAAATFAIEPALAGFAIDASSGAITYTGADLIGRATNGVISLTVQSTIGTDVQTSTISITVNDAPPAITLSGTGQATNTGDAPASPASVGIAVAYTDDGAATPTSYTFTTAAGAAVDYFVVDSGNIAVASGVDFFTNQDTNEMLNYIIIATDAGGNTAREEFSITVVENGAPTSTLTDQIFIVGDESGSATIPSLFTDAGGDTITGYTATLTGGGALPAWITIDATTGALTVDTSAAQASVSVAIVATDDGPAGINMGTHTINIEVEAQQDVVATDATFSITENMDGSTTAITVGTVTAADANTRDTVASWAIAGHADFAISNAGVITYTGAGLDADTATGGTGTITLTATATSSDGSTDPATVTVNVMGVNEMPEAEGTIPDQTASSLGGSSTTIDVSSYFSDPDGDTLTYTASVGAGATATVSGSTLTMSSSTVGTYMVTVTATDPGGLAVSQAAFTLTVIENGPPTSTLGNQSFVEGDNSGSIEVATLFTDAGGDTITGYTAALADGGLLPSWITIDANTGALTVDTSAAQASVDITISATDDGTTPGNTVGTHTISIVVAADAPPSFTTIAQTISVAENDGTAATQLTINATDANGDTVTYAFDDGGTYAAGITVSSTTITIAGTTAYRLDATSGVITYLGNELDYDTLTTAQRSFAVDVIASSQGAGRTAQTDTVAITFEVTNVDEPLEFTTTAYSATVAENAAAGALTITPAFDATDPDMGDDVTYGLADTMGGLFSINAATGAIRTTRALNYEDYASTSGVITLTLTATSSGTTTPVEATVTVTVTDVDEPTSLEQTNAQTATFVSGEATTALVDTGIRITVTDPDASGLQGVTASGFSITRTEGTVATSVYTINEISTGVFGISVAAGTTFNEVQTLSITLTDGASPALTSAALPVTIGFAPDVPPVFASPAALSGDVDETNLSGSDTVASRAIATDEDGHAITYELRGADAASFDTRVSGGMVEIFTRTASAFNHETKDTYNFQLVAIANNAETAPIDVIVTINDLQEAPTFPAGSDSFSIAEDADNGAALGTVTAATDPDDGDTAQIRYSITAAVDDSTTNSVLGDNLFAIDAITGAITVNGATPLDRERADGGFYTLTITATSPGGTATRTVNVEVTNVNEISMFGRESYNATVVENNAAGESVGNFGVSADPEGDTLIYDITAGDTGDIFAIDNSGNITVTNANALNHEGTDSYTLTIRVRDGNGGEDTATVNISVTDVNEDTTTGGTAGATIPNQNVSGGTYPADVEASGYFSDPDDDGESFGDLRYSLSANAAGLGITIDEMTGTISFGATSTTSGTHTITVTAQAAQSGSNSVNQNFTYAFNAAPVVNSNAGLTLNEGATAVSAALSATDTDGTIASWDIVGGADMGLFTIAADGQLTYTGPALDYEADTSRTFTLDVTATDNSGATSVSRTITIAVANVEEGPVMTAGSHETFNIVRAAANAHGTENLDTGLRFSVVNPETGMITGTPTVNLSGTIGNNEFEVHRDGDDSMPGLQTPVRSGGYTLEEVSTGVYGVFLIAAADLTSGGAHQVGDVRVIYQDNEGSQSMLDLDFSSRLVADSAPDASVDMAARTFAEGTSSGTVATVTASDVDVATTPWQTGVVLSLNDNFGGLFSLDASTGVITIAGALDHEATTTGIYTLTVTATTTGGLSGSNTDTVNVVVTVSDVDEALSGSATLTAADATPATGEALTVTNTYADDDFTGDWTYTWREGTNVVRTETTSATTDTFSPTTAGSYTVQITRAVSTGTALDETTNAVTVDTSNTVPTVNQPAGLRFNENADGTAGNGVFVADFQATDTDGHAITGWRLTGTDAGMFSITMGTNNRAALRYTGAALDFEASGVQTSFSFNVIATDSEGGDSLPTAQTVTLTNLDDETPTLTADGIAFNGRNINVNSGAAGGSNVDVSTFFTDTDGSDFAIEYSIADHAGSGITLSGSTLSYGTVGAAGDYAVVITATDTDGATATVTFNYLINGAPVLDGVSKSSGAITAGTSTTLNFTVTLNDDGRWGDGIFAYTTDFGTNPDGLSIAAGRLNTRVSEGIPRQLIVTTGANTFTGGGVRTTTLVINDGLDSNSVSLIYFVNSAAVAAISGSASSLVGGASTAQATGFTLAITDEDDGGTIGGNSTTNKTLAEYWDELDIMLGSNSVKDAFSIDGSGAISLVASQTDVGIGADQDFTIVYGNDGDSAVGMNVGVDLTVTGATTFTLTLAAPPRLGDLSVYESTVISGTDAADTIDESADSNRQIIYGGHQNDTIIASNNGDIIIGGYGNDDITLGDGNDIVIHRFSSAVSANGWRNDDGGDDSNNITDIMTAIRDFNPAEDILVLVDTNSTSTPINTAQGFIDNAYTSGTVRFTTTFDALFENIIGIRIDFQGVYDVDGPGTSTDATLNALQIIWETPIAIDFATTIAVEERFFGDYASDGITAEHVDVGTGSFNNTAAVQAVFLEYFKVLTTQTNPGFDVISAATLEAELDSGSYNTFADLL